MPPLNLKTHEFKYPAEDLSSKRHGNNISPKSKDQKTSEVSESKQPKYNIKYSKLVDDLKKIEDKFDRHEIDVSMNQSSAPLTDEQMLENATKDRDFLHKIFLKVTSKYDHSELNSFKMSLLKEKQSNESKVIRGFYNLFSRIVEGQQL